VPAPEWRLHRSGTGAFERLRGSGEMEVTYDPDDDALGRETFTGTVTR
jgi:hypothetical protein